VTQKQKLQDKFIKNPESVSYKNLLKVLLDVGFVQVSVKGSHVKFKHLALPHDLVIPVHNNECKPFYKREAQKLVKQVLK
jgi:predicted RNA binding protein YcfA (HicA-like mRNA interferase family)